MLRRNLTIRKKMGRGALIFLAGLLAAAAAQAEPALKPIKESYAYQQFSRRKATELSKLLYLLDRFKDSEYHVLYDGMEYDAVTALKYARQYVAKHYRQEKASEWLQKNAYRSVQQGNIIYIKEPDATTRILRDVLLEELQTLEALKPAGAKS